MKINIFLKWRMDITLVLHSNLRIKYVLLEGMITQITIKCKESIHNCLIKIKLLLEVAKNTLYDTIY